MNEKLILRKVSNIQDSSFDELYKIYTDSFVDDEIREIDQKQLDKGNYTLYAAEMNNEIAGFISTWDLGDYVFVEHVAISSKLRGQGVGSIVFEEIHKLNAGRRVVLEVKRPHDKDSERRIEFYKRLNYCLNMFEYIQPPISEGKSAVPMYLMTLVESLSEEGYVVIRDMLYKEVYNYNMD